MRLRLQLTRRLSCCVVLVLVLVFVLVEGEGGVVVVVVVLRKAPVVVVPWCCVFVCALTPILHYFGHDSFSTSLLCQVCSSQQGRTLLYGT